jgi:hypothetical protein
MGLARKRAKFELGHGLVDDFIVILKKLTADGMTLNTTDISWCQGPDSEIKLGMVIGADTDDVHNYIGAIMGLTKRANVVRLCIPGTINHDNGVPA